MRGTIRGKMKKAVMILVLLLAFSLSLASVAGAAEVNFKETAVEYSELKSQLGQMLKNQKGTYGVFVIDLNSGKTLGINSQEHFHAASTFKLPMNIYLYKKIAEGSVNPKTMLVYKQAHYEGGTGKLQYKPVGSSFSIDMLSKYSIIYSDNVATNMLLSYLGKVNVKDYMRSMGGVVVENNQNITCPQDMALYMYKLLEFAGKQPLLANQLIDKLENTIYNERIPKLLPRNIKVAHKIGNWPPTGTYNDVGYVQHPENPYIIAVFSKGTSGSAAAYNVIQRVSKAVYDYQSKLVNINLIINGRLLDAGASPVLVNNSVLVPLRIVSEALQAEVKWDGAAKTVNISKPGQEIELKIGEPNASINGVQKTLVMPAKIINNTTMVPLRFISETLGAVVEWDSESKTVKITS